MAGAKKKKPNTGGFRDKIRNFSLWASMVKNPWPYLVAVPIFYAVLIGVGWTRDDRIEEDIANIWIAQRGSYASDIRYAKELGVLDWDSSAFAAMAIAQKGDNLFTATNLERIRSRMEETEKTTVTYKGITFTWDDICAVNSAPYQLPCARLSPMDYFQEARWFFNEAGRLYWYNDLIKNSLLLPRVNRFGVLMNKCAPDKGVSVCQDLMEFRIKKTNNTIALLGDVGNLEYSDDCRICIEENYTKTIEDLYELTQASFAVLNLEIKRYQEEQKRNISEATQNQLSVISRKLEGFVENVTKNDIEEFYFYYIIRYAYSELGYPSYLDKYNNNENFTDLVQTCIESGAWVGLTHCPPINITEAEAKQSLLNHADNAFSSVTTSGAPFPMWSAANGTGSLFKGNFPVSGSGINMSASMQSAAVYLDVENYDVRESNNTEEGKVWLPVYGADGYINITSLAWNNMIETNPLYAWFMASQEPADEFCGNGYLTGTDTNVALADNKTKEVFMNNTQMWCNDYTIPRSRGDGNYTKQYFAKMWYDLLMDSPSFLNIQKGYDDPYSWTTGAGCGYTLGGSRHNYTNMNTKNILYNASRVLYFYDEGVKIGAVSTDMLLGDVKPENGAFSLSNPLEKVGVLQTLYAALTAERIFERVKDCQRPNGPINNITVEDAHEVLYQFKEAMEKTWTQGWEDPSESVQFVCFFDETSTLGTTGRMLVKVTVSNSSLTAISILMIAVFSVMFLIDCDYVESRALVTLVAVSLVLVGYYAALGFSILVGIKINVTIAWTLPFLIMGLGVDDAYIVLMALKKQRGYSEQDFLQGMREVIVPVTMTSVVNACMFAVLNVSDIPAVYVTAQAALYCVIFLWMGVVLCFPAYCYLDMKRQADCRYDMLFCLKRSTYSNDGAVEEEERNNSDYRSKLLYDWFFRPLVLGENRTLRTLVTVLIMAGAMALLGVGAWGITKRKIGVGLEDFFPSTHQASVWATKRTESLASFPIGIQWGANNYSDPNIQMQVIKQFEDIIATNYTNEIDTKQLWLAEFSLWASRLCDANIGSTFDQPKCGRDQTFPGDNTDCSATWKLNTFGLREKIFSDYDSQTCRVYEGGICRPIPRMHPDDINEIIIKDPSLDVTDTTLFCPTIDGWSGRKWQFCLTQWRNVTGTTNGGLLTEEGTASKTECEGVYKNDLSVIWPIPFATSPTMFAYNLFTHEDTLDMMHETRQFCDDHETLHCWMTGIPFDYWTQYETIDKVLLELCCYSSAAGFVISFLFLYTKFTIQGLHERPKILCGSLIGAALITVTCIMSLVAVIGCSVFAGVNLTGFSTMSFVLSVGFSVEYSVHIVSRWLKADLSEKTSLDRVRYTMSFLMLPTFMSFTSSTIGVVCLAFTQFEYITIFYFRPLIIVMFVTYFYGCFWLPVFLTFIDFEVVKLGKASPRRVVADVAASRIARVFPTEVKTGGNEDDRDEDDYN